jgi:hypothetical protein
MNQRSGFKADPPFLLVEGWAESQAGPTRATLASLALDSRDRWLARTSSKPGANRSYLGELVGPAWHHHIGAPVYDVGGAFADFLIRHFGMGRVVRLYFTARPGTFEADCRNILGVDFEALETTFWQDAEIQRGSDSENTAQD